MAGCRALGCGCACPSSSDAIRSGVVTQTAHIHTRDRHKAPTSLRHLPPVPTDGERRFEDSLIRLPKRMRNPHNLPCIFLHSQVHSYQSPLARLACKNRFYRPPLTHRETIDQTPTWREPLQPTHSTHPIHLIRPGQPTIPPCPKCPNPSRQAIIADFTRLHHLGHASMGCPQMSQTSSRVNSGSRRLPVCRTTARMRKPYGSCLPCLQLMVTLLQGVPGDGSPLAGVRGVPAHFLSFSQAAAGGIREGSEYLQLVYMCYTLSEKPLMEEKVWPQ